MSFLLNYGLGLLGGALVGCVSALIVFSAAVALQRTCGFRREMTIAVLGLIGIAACFAGQLTGIRWLGAGVLLWGWVALVVVAGIVFVLWRGLLLVVTMWQRITRRPS